MKKIFSYFLLITALLLAFACEKKENEQQPVATMTGTYYVGVDVEEKVFEVAPGKSKTIMVRALADEGQVSDLTVNISFKADPDAVAAYNSAHSTDYVMCPGSAYEFTVVEAMMPRYGRASSSARLKLSASGLEDDTIYILPLTIDKVTGTDKWELAAKPQAYLLFKKTFVAPDAGKGTPEEPYNLYTAADVVAMTDLLVEKKMTYFRLQADIDMSGVENWVPLNYKSPYDYLIDFDGNGHTIDNFKCTFSSYPSFFGVLYGNCYDVTFTNAYIECDAASGCGILGGYGGTGDHHCEVNRVHVHGKVILNGNKTGVGGMFGCLANGNISASSSDVDVYSTKNYVGGLVGYCKNTPDGNHITDCWTGGSVRGDQRVGGIAGGINGDGDEIINCYSVAKLYIMVEGEKEYAATRSVGGIVAHANQDKADQNTTRTPGNVVQGCIAWQDEIKTRTYLGATLDGNDFYSSGAIVAFGATQNTYANCYRRPDLDFRDYSDLFLLYNQENTSPASPLVVKAVEGNTHNFPYHGKAAPAGKTVSQLAKSLGWSASIWDLSGDLPVLKGKPEGPDEPEEPDPSGQLPDYDENELYN